MSLAARSEDCTPAGGPILEYTIDMAANVIPSLKMTYWLNDTLGEVGRDWRLVKTGDVYQAQFRTGHQRDLFVNRWSFYIVDKSRS